MFNEARLSKAPKALDPVNTPSPKRTAVDGPLADADSHKTSRNRILCMDDGTPSDHFNRVPQQSLRPDIFQHLHLDQAVPLQDAKDRDFTRRATATFPFAVAAKVSFIGFHFPGARTFFSGVVGQDGPPHDGYRLQYCGVTQTHLLGDFAAGQFQFKELCNPQPLPAGNFHLIKPTACGFVKIVSTRLTSKPAAAQTINPATMAFLTENLAILSR